MRASHACLDLLNRVDVAHLLDDGNTAGVAAFDSAADRRLGPEHIDNGALELLVIGAKGRDVVEAALELGVAAIRN